MPHRPPRLTTKIVAVAAMFAAPATAAAADARLPAVPRRIVSLNLCADQYLLALADRAQIAGLTRNAGDRAMSAAAAEAKGLHIMGSSSEEVLALDPDLIVGMPARRSGIMAALNARDYRIVDLKPAASFAEIIAQTRTVAAAVGQAARGEALIARMERALARLPRRRDAPVAAYYQRRGFLTGTGTLVDELMGRVGLVNLAGRLDLPVLSQMPLEALVAARPDYLIVESNADHVTDQGTEMLHHPILDDIPRLRLPQAWTVCGGPAYVRAAESLARQLAEAPSRRRGGR